MQIAVHFLDGKLSSLTLPIPNYHTIAASFAIFDFGRNVPVNASNLFIMMSILPNFYHARIFIMICNQIFKKYFDISGPVNISHFV